ncbi:MAG TPA: hypothetical protein VF789_20730 [Thermoanaerobaculia bacterium]
MRHPRLLILLITLALLLAAPRSAASAPSWTALGPFGGSVGWVAVDPEDARTVYATAGEEGLFKSTNAGFNWTKVLQAYVAAKPAVAPGGVLYVSVRTGKVKKSTDGGLHWTLSGQGLPESLVTSLVVDPAVPSRLYAVSDARLWRSTDAGASWHPAPTKGLPRQLGVNQVVAARRPSGLVYIASSQGVWKSWNGGRTWQSANGNLSVYSRKVYGLVVSPTDSRTLYASIEGSYRGVVLYRSTDGGGSWKATAYPPTSKYIASQTLVLEVSPRSPLLVFAMFFNVIGRDQESLYRSTDGGGHWTAVGLTGTSFWSLTVAPSALRYVYAACGGSKSSGVMASEDGGLTWGWRGGIAALDAVAFAPDPGGQGVLWLSTGEKLFRSATGGIRWQRQQPLLNGQVMDVAVPPLAPLSAYVLFYSYGSGTAEVWWTPDRGLSWTRTGSAGGLNPKNRLWADPADPEVLWADSRGSLYRSPDAGATWEYQDVTDEVALGDLKFAPSRPSTVYLAGVRAASDGSVRRAGVLRSDDGGVHWTRADAGLDAPPVTALAVDPVDPRRVYAATRDSLNPLGDGLWVTGDGGATWARAGEELRGLAIEAVAASPVAGVVWASTEDGRLFRSGDGGATWEERTESFPASRIHGLAFDPFDPLRLYAVTSGGLYVTMDEP